MLIAIGLVSLVVLLVVTAFNTPGSPAGAGTSGIPASRWSTPQASALRASFLAGCERTGGSISGCECAFAHITA
ncbi:MAG TPA: hypothetical protein VIJ33_07440, partial [Solirubrobacteraceae bacterium]